MDLATALVMACSLEVRAQTSETNLLLDRQSGRSVDELHDDARSGADSATAYVSAGCLSTAGALLLRWRTARLSDAVNHVQNFFFRRR